MSDKPGNADLRLGFTDLVKARKALAESPGRILSETRTGEYTLYISFKDYCMAMAARQPTLLDDSWYWYDLGVNGGDDTLPRRTRTEPDTEKVTQTKVKP